MQGKEEKNDHENKNNGEQNQNEINVQQTAFSAQKKCTHNRALRSQKTERERTVAFQIKLPSWSFKSCLSHQKDVDYYVRARAHTHSKGTARKWHEQNERKSRTNSSSAHTQCTGLFCNKV